MTLLGKALLCIAVIIVVVAVGTYITYWLSLNNGFNLQHLSLLNSIYYTVDTLTTNSYGDIVPISATARLFTIITEVAGVSIFIGALTILTGEIMDIRLKGITGEISEAEARLLRNHTVLIGVNSVNMYLAERLKLTKKKFVLLTNSKDHFDTLRDTGYPIHVANFSSKESLNKYGLAFAEKVVIDTLEKSQAMYTYMVVKELAGKKTQIKIITRDQDTEKYFALIAKGANEEIINPEYDVAMDIIGSKQ